MSEAFKMSVVFKGPPAKSGPPAKPVLVKKRVSNVDRIADIAKRRGRKGLTMDEACILLGIVTQSCSPCFTKLSKDGILIRTEERRPTRTGKTSRVYIHRDRV